jgi:hypothetical protein
MSVSGACEKKRAQLRAQLYPAATKGLKDCRVLLCTKLCTLFACAHISLPPHTHMATHTTRDFAVSDFYANFNAAIASNSTIAVCSIDPGWKDNTMLSLFELEFSEYPCMPQEKQVSITLTQTNRVAIQMRHPSTNAKTTLTERMLCLQRKVNGLHIIQPADFTLIERQLQQPASDYCAVMFSMAATSSEPMLVESNAVRAKFGIATGSHYYNKLEAINRVRVLSFTVHNTNIILHPDVLLPPGFTNMSSAQHHYCDTVLQLLYLLVHKTDFRFIKSNGKPAYLHLPKTESCKSNKYNNKKAHLLQEAINTHIEKKEEEEDDDEDLINPRPPPLDNDLMTPAHDEDFDTFYTPHQPDYSSDNDKDDDDEIIDLTAIAAPPLTATEPKRKFGSMY